MSFAERDVELETRKRQRIEALKAQGVKFETTPQATDKRTIQAPAFLRRPDIEFR